MTAEDPVAAWLQELRLDAGLTVRAGPLWTEVLPDGVTLPEHGWKLHVSSRPSTYRRLVGKLLPALVAEGCCFKLVPSAAALAVLNDGTTAPLAVGKAFTIYPSSDRVVGLGLELAALLHGEPGPRVLSDRAVAKDSPVYYRFGPFTGSSAVDGYGRPLRLLTGPGGEEWKTEATSEYRQPSWVTDPFTQEPAHVAGPSESLLGNRYRTTEGIFLSARGNVYRAVDTRTGNTLIVKQARAFVAESDDGVDTRLRLRNERRILEAATGIRGVPHVLDHFRHADDEFLVMSDQGPINLFEEIEEQGSFPATGERSLSDLAHRIAVPIDALHARKILVRDLSPKNVVLRSGSRDLSLIDFGFAAFDGLQLTGHTPQYGPPRQILGEPARETDDLYALGMTLIHAATGLPPVTIGTDLSLPRRRGLHALADTAADDGMVAVIADLVSEEPLRARSALDAILENRTSDYRTTTAPARGPEFTMDMVDDVLSGALDVLLESVDDMLARSHGLDGSPAPSRNPSILTGNAGTGLELLHHRSRAGIDERLEHLAAATEATLGSVDLPPGLFIGRTGAELFLLAGGYPVERRFPDVSYWPDSDDVFKGIAGLGLGHLFLHDLSRDSRDLDVAVRCADGLPNDFMDKGFAHGLAGALELRLSLADRSHEVPVDLEKQIPVLVDHAQDLIDRAKTTFSDALAVVSACNGLSGVARVILHAARTLDRAEYAAVAVVAGEICASWVPRLENLGSCCGASGIGELLLDLAVVTGDERWSHAALSVGRHLLLRSGGTSDRPIFLKPRFEEGSASWGNGLAGILGFLRRLRNPHERPILPCLSALPPAMSITAPLVPPPKHSQRE